MKNYNKCKAGILAIVWVALFDLPLCLAVDLADSLDQQYDHVMLDNGWNLQNTAELDHSAHWYSEQSIVNEEWHNASVPSTVMGVLTENGTYDDNELFMGKNIRKVDTTQFNTPWLYRKSFECREIQKNEKVMLNFDGISYYANIWLNGAQIASKDSVFGIFRRFSFDVTALVKPSNILVVEVFRQVAGDFGIGFVDWNPRPMDGSMGVWRPVTLEINGSIGLSNTYVDTKVNLETLEEAWLNVRTSLQNHSNKKVKGSLEGRLGDKTFSYPVTLEANEQTTLNITSKEVPELYMINPRLWWSNGLGEPNLYDLELKFQSKTGVSDLEEVTFGVREVEDYFTEDGYRGYKLNGREVLIRGGGWTDDIFLRDTPETNEIQVQYTKDMNLNTIRFENIWGTSQNIYDLCDQYGILAMVGWTCHWEWDNYALKKCDEDYGCILTEDEADLMAKSLEDQILWLRNHPSIFVWMVGSDKLPIPSLEARYKEIIKKLDGRPYLAVAGGAESTVSGLSGVKMNGPYEYVGPNYWYVDKVNGGAFGFNTETGPGPQIPVKESLVKMIPEKSLWPKDQIWDYKCTQSSTELNSLEYFDKAQNANFGYSKNLDEYLRKSAALQYDAIRGMFEAFRVNRDQTTGLIQWMLNSAWPNLYWQLYDYYLLPTPAYYAVKNSNKPVQVAFNYADGHVYAVNENMEDLTGMALEILLLDVESKPILNQKITFEITSNKSIKVFELPAIEGVKFLNLKLTDSNGQDIGNNFYWLSEKQDEYQWEKSDWWGIEMKGFADFNALNGLPKAQMNASYKIERKADQVIVQTTLTNESDKLAFMLDLGVKDESGASLYPVFWEDNYISLLPGESRVISCIVDESLVIDKKLRVEVNGWNIDPIKMSLEKVSQ